MIRPLESLAVIESGCGVATYSDCDAPPNQMRAECARQLPRLMSAGVERANWRNGAQVAGARLLSVPTLRLETKCLTGDTPTAG